MLARVEFDVFELPVEYFMLFFAAEIRLRIHRVTSLYFLFQTLHRAGHSISQ